MKKKKSDLTIVEKKPTLDHTIMKKHKKRRKKYKFWQFKDKH